MLTDIEKRDVHAALVGILGKDRAAYFFLEGMNSEELSRYLDPPAGRGPAPAPAGVHPGVQGGSA